MLSLNNAKRNIVYTKTTRYLKFSSLNEISPIYISPKGETMTNSTYENFRYLVVFVYTILRFALFRLNMQTYLNVAKANSKSFANLAKKIQVRDYKVKIIAPFYYVCVAAIQILGPILLLFFTLLLVLSLGDLELPFWPLPLIPTNQGFVLTAQFTRPVFSFCCWWLCFVQFVVSLVTLFFYRFFTVTN